MKVSLRVGNFVFESEQSDFRNQVLELQNMKPRHKCDVCGNTDKTKFDIRARKAHSEKMKQDFIFIEMTCFAPREDEDKLCWAKSNLGEYADKSGFFWKEFVRFEKENSSSSKTQRDEEEEEEEFGLNRSIEMLPND